MPLRVEPNETYHAHPAFSKSKLWRYHTMTPYRAEFEVVEHKPEFDVGTSAHTAILEPELLDDLIVKGPADRRGKKWDHPFEEAQSEGKILLTESDFDLVHAIRDAAMTVPELQQMLKGKTYIERSCYAVDEETGAEIKCRPDVYNEDLKGMADLKSLADISDSAWERYIGTLGYHMQDAMYPDVWSKGSGLETDFFFFVCFSKTIPVEVVCREIAVVDVEEGFQVYRHALKLAQECRSNQNWPSYPRGIVRGVMMRDQHRRFTEPQWRKPATTETVETIYEEGDVYA